MKQKKKGYQGSMTLEAVLVVPLYLFVMISLYSTIEMIRLQGDFQMVLMQTGKEIALYSAATDLLGGLEEDADGIENVLGVLYARSVFSQKFSQEYLEEMGVNNGINGISFWRSGFLAEEDLVDLVITYELEPMCNFGGFANFSMVNRCRLKAWTGYEIEESEATPEQMVYVTENGSVYHLSRSCTYLSLSICPILYDDVENYSNDEGDGYRYCDLCIGEPGKTVYITTYGDCYHTSLTCGSLRRTISEIPISEVGEMRSCSRCGE